MQSISSLLKGNLAYVFVVVGLVWLGLVVLTSSTLVLWPVLACLISGALLKLRPASNLTTAWASASALMGLALSAYQVYVAAPLVTSDFATIAGASVAAFVVFGLFQLYLLAVSYSAK
ncbi:MAG: hypothetical protein LYZ69_00015 [Nitrososphaerales archaeon]|nr:hypothetical protein [Nitrososphaerales archaeon]